MKNGSIVIVECLGKTRPFAPRFSTFEHSWAAQCLAADLKDSYADTPDFSPTTVNSVVRVTMKAVQS